jgi:hypothetical protein
LSIDYMQVAVNASEQEAREARFKRFLSDDPMEQKLQAQTAAEHAAAKVRGEKIRAIAERVAWELHAKGELRVSHKDVERELIRALADALYPGVAVDI